MESLTHVCMWTRNGWKRITAEEAELLFPKGTVSADSGLFMCELCGQFVSLTDGDVRKRYFKHSRADKIKDCPERTFANEYKIQIDPRKHELPIKIMNADKPMSDFYFEMGLIKAPTELLGKDFRVVIKTKGLNQEKYEYLRERINEDRITYVYIGKVPAEKYSISFINGKEKLHEFWPAEIHGIDPEGTLFEKNSGRKLAFDSDVEIGKEYFLLIQGKLEYDESCEGLNIDELSTMGVRGWTLYKVSANVLNENAAKFFLIFHCRLTNHPVSLQPVWPLYVEDDHLMTVNGEKVFMLLDGPEGNETKIELFPSGNVRRISKYSDATKIYKISCNGRQQLLSIYRTHILQYTYLWREPIDCEGKIPNISVTDKSGARVGPGKTSSLPKGGALLFNSEFDGELIIRNSSCLLEKRKIKANADSVEINKLTFNMCIQFFVGLDLIWQIEFVRSTLNYEDDEVSLLRQIETAKGIMIPVPHSLKNMIIGLDRYPQLCQWIRNEIDNGYIREQAYRKLQELYLKINSN